MLVANIYKKLVVLLGFCAVFLNQFAKMFAAFFKVLIKAIAGSGG